MDVDVPAPPEVPIEQTRKTNPLTDIAKFRIIELRKAPFLASHRALFVVGDLSSRTERGFRFE
jgi:hypothetical protein